MLGTGSESGEVPTVQDEHAESRHAREDEHRPGLAEQERGRGQHKAATIDETDAYRVSAKTRIQTSAPIRPTSGASPRSAPP